MLVSVVMPTYNCAEYISQSIESVIAQTFSDWELQIVDDCSTDNTYQVVLPYLERYSNIHYHCLGKNSGASVARSEAIRRATGKYIAFLDSDDIWKKEKLERQIQFMQKTGAKMSATAYRRISVDGQSLGVVLVPPEKMDYRYCLRHSDPIGNLTVMYDQEELGKFVVPEIRKRNDFALWLQILKKTEYCYGMTEVLAEYRMGRGGAISTRTPQLAKYHWMLYHKIEGHGILRSMYEMCCWAVVKGTGLGLDIRREK